MCVEDALACVPSEQNGMWRIKEGEEHDAGNKRNFQSGVFSTRNE
jgi:hypothetical protein